MHAGQVLCYFAMRRRPGITARVMHAPKAQRRPRGGAEIARGVLTRAPCGATLRVVVNVRAPHDGEERSKIMAAFKVADITRNRTVGWGIMPEDAKPGSTPKPRAITTADFTDAEGNLLAGDALKAKVASVKGTVVVEQIGYITVADLPKEYAESPRAALTKLAAEWSEGSKDADGKPVKWTSDEVMHYLSLQSRMQDAANASIKQHRPVSDKALDRATSTIVKTMKSNGKTLAEIMAVLAATGATVTESSVREAYGA